MIKLLFKRCLQLIPTVFVLSVIAFSIVHVIPGDPVEIMLGTTVDRSNIEAERERLGLNDPLYEQYGRFVVNAVSGDLGTSIVTKQAVSSEIIRRFQPTIILAVGSTLFATVVGIVLGVVSALNKDKWIDQLILVGSQLSVSTPSFFLALILMLLFSLIFKWFPSYGFDSPQHVVLPIITLGIGAVGNITRTTRSAMLDVLNEEYIKTSLSRGYDKHTIYYKHALKNALIPIITAVGSRFGSLLAGATVIETVFTISGIGRYLVDGVANRDYPVIQGTILVLSVVFVVINTLIDMCYIAVDPRVKVKG